MVTVEKKNGEKRKEGGKYEVEEMRVTKELSHSLMPAKKVKKGFFFLIIASKKLFCRMTRKQIII